MPTVVVTGGMLQCSHGGQTRFTQGSPKLTVNGVGVVVSGMETGLSFAVVPPAVTVCPFTSGGNPSPCTSTLAATSGISTKLLVGGLGVLLNTAGGSTVNTPSATWQVSAAGQSILTES